MEVVDSARRLVASAAYDGAVRLHGGEGEVLAAAGGHRGAAKCVSLHVHGGRGVAVSGSKDHGVRVWQVEAGEGAGASLRPLAEGVGHAGSVECAAVCDTHPVVRGDWEGVGWTVGALTALRCPRAHAGTHRRVGRRDSAVATAGTGR